MYKTLIIGILLCIYGLYLILNSKRIGKETMDWYRNLYRNLGLKRLIKTVTKEDEREEGKGAFIIGIICLIIGVYGIITFVYYHFT
jgi:uncharacterized membrane protein YfcA